MSCSLLGEDGHGYELAQKLESVGVWRTWLGDSAYASFTHNLASPAAWDSFMRPDPSKPKSQIHLQLRARALLFDKAILPLSSRPFSNFTNSSCSLAISKLNPNYLQLHADDVYFTLERENSGASSNSTSLSSKSKGAQVASRYGDYGKDNMSQKFSNDDLPETWYNQYFEKYKASRPYKLTFGERDSDKRTAEEMSAFIGLTEKHKKRRVAFVEDQSVGSGNLISETTLNRASTITSESNGDDVNFLPEVMFTWNCVPDSALPSTVKFEEVRKVEVREIFDMLPQALMTRNAVMIERLGIRPENLNMEQRGSMNRRKIVSQSNKNPLSQEQACQMSQKAVAKLLTNVGFESATEVPMEVLSQLLGCHIRKLGRMLKILADSYRKQCSPIELLKMFLHTAGYGNCMALAEHIKDGSRIIVQQTQQHTHGIHSQMQPQQGPVRIPQQIPRQMHPQMQQVHQQTLAFQQQLDRQQQLERMRRRQPATPRAGIDMDRDRPLVQVKLENPSELPMDGSAFNTMNPRHPQMQIRQQQLAAMSNFQAQSGNQFRQMASLQVPPLQQTQSMSTVRAPPVKVEGFQELMGGDTSLKHDAEENKLTSPQSK